MTEPQIANSELLITSASIQGQVSSSQELKLTTTISSAQDQVTVTELPIILPSPAPLEPISNLSPSALTISDEIKIMPTLSTDQADSLELTPLLPSDQPTVNLSQSMVTALDEFTLIPNSGPSELISLASVPVALLQPPFTILSPDSVPLQPVTPAQPSLARRVLENTGSMAKRALIFAPTRRLILTTALYAAGGPLIATFGFFPVAFSALAIWTT